LTDASEAIAQDATAQDLANQLQGAELAAANLAAQMSASAAKVPVPVASNSAEVSAALSISATSQPIQEAVQASQAPVVGPNLQEGEQVAPATTLATTQNTATMVLESNSTSNVSKSQLVQQLEGNASTESQLVRMATSATTQVQVALSDQSDAARNVPQLNASSKANAAGVSAAQAQLANTAASFNSIKPDSLQQEDAAIQSIVPNQPSLPAEKQVTSDPALSLKSEVSAVKANVSSDTALAAAANVTSSQTSVSTASTVTNVSDSKIDKTNSTQAAPIDTASPTQSIGIASVATEKTKATSSANADTQDANGQESAFNFDAKLAKTDPQQNPKVIETSISLAGVAKSSAQVQNTSLTANETELSVQGALAVSSTLTTDSDATTFGNVQSGMKAGRVAEALPAAASSPTASTAPAYRLESAALTAASPNSSVIAQEAPRAETTQSLEDISSSFVSSLVGGPQRPVTTVMDWISMQSLERPAPLVPHEVRLDAGAVQMEIQKMVKQGGGHVVMELTPPDQSKFTIELKLDERGGALLIVEGVSDSTKTRLEQSAPQLREQFQQMGLELQLDMRQQGQSASSSAADFAGSQERGASDNNLNSNGTGDTPKILTQREAGANRARETGSNQVYLYA